MSECAEWLKRYLHDIGHEVLVDVVRGDAKLAGFTRGQLKDARKELGVVTVNDNEGDGITCMWWWDLPERSR